MSAKPAHAVKRMVERSSAVRFVIIGVIATAIHYGIYYLLLWAGVWYTPAYALGYAVSLGFNFWASGRFTFRTGLTAGKGLKFAASHAVNFVLHMSLLEIFVRVAGISDKIAPIFVLCIAVPVNFLLVRASMRDKKPNDE